MTFFHEIKRRRNLLIASALASCQAVGQQPAPAPSNSLPGVDLTRYGGVCDGKTDNSAALMRGLADAKAKGVALEIPVGQCNFSQVIRATSTSIKGSGDGSVLYATDFNQAALFLYGTGFSVQKVKLTGAQSPSRGTSWEMMKIVIFGASDFAIDRVTIDTSPAGGIMVDQRSTRGRVTNNTVKNTLADSIHMTGGSSYMTVEGNRIENSGDDGIAVVSYRYNGARVNNIIARNNVILNNEWGRGMSVVGGDTVLYENNYIAGNQSACLYIAQENSYQTYSALNVTAKSNTLKNCGSMMRHAAAMVFSDGAEANNNITLLRNDIIQRDGRTGIRYFGPQTNLRFEQNRYTGFGTAVAGSGATAIPYSDGPVGYVAP